MKIILIIIIGSHELDAPWGGPYIHNDWFLYKWDSEVSALSDHSVRYPEKFVEDHSSGTTIN